MLGNRKQSLIAFGHVQYRVLLVRAQTAGFSPVELLLSVLSSVVTHVISFAQIPCIWRHLQLQQYEYLDATHCCL